MSEMVERVANALIRCEDAGDVLVSARAAIAAMREPTPGMGKAAECEYHTKTYRLSYAEASELFDAWPAHSKANVIRLFDITRSFPNVREAFVAAVEAESGRHPRGVPMPRRTAIDEALK